MERNTDYDVIIVGGRVAGSTLAAYLGKAGIRVLLLERAVFPEPHPASSPMIQPITMSMLDEIGADENEYARDTARIRRMLAVDTDFELVLDIPDIGGRNYAYAIDRARFDHALWDNAVSYDSVDGWMGFSVTNLMWDSLGKTVIGIEGKRKREKHYITAGVVVGADGRFSMVARKVGAAEHNKHDDHPTTLYYTYWKNVKPHDEGEPTTVATGAPDGKYGYLLMDSADGTTCVCIEGRSDIVQAINGLNIEEFYMDMLQRNAYVWKRLQDAEPVDKVRGMRKVGNLFREPAGNGWALVGDAYHQKDPIDGQGIYDSVYSSRTLAQALIDWHSGDRTWDDAMTWYDRTAQQEMMPQYEQTLNRVQQQMYPSSNLPIPKPLLNTTVRWLSRDRVYRELAGLALNRQIDPREAATPKFLALAVLRGGLRELSERLDPPPREKQIG
ncbi:MAG: NAD(P)/FAD-dependent oxidoreductase [Chloroflexota bacterium]